ncbi:MAG: ATP-binding protein [Planctomycetaceae bacterium]
MPSLFVIQGRNLGARYDLDAFDGPVSIGREAGNLVQLDDNEVSRRHAELRPADGAHVIVDLTSSNGTFVNGRRVERAALAPGDQVLVGRTVLSYARPPRAAQETVDIVEVRHDDDSRIVSTLGDDDRPDRGGRTDPDDRRLSRARSNLQVMYRTALAVSHTLDIDELLDRILQLVFEWVEADRGCVMLLDPVSRVPEAKARRDRRSGNVASMAISRTILDWVLERDEGVLTSDARDDDRFSSGHSVLRTGVREAICVPMRGRYGTVGLLYVDTTTPLADALGAGQRRFTDDHLKLMMAIGHQAALAVEDTTYYSAMVQSERLAAVGHTIATLSHHIKNILQGIRGGSYLVEMGLENEDLAVVRKGWDIVSRNQNKISSLVMDMLSFSKDRRPEPMATDLAALIGDIVETVHHRASEAGIEIRWAPPAGLPRMYFDPEGMARAVLNVVTNALDAAEGRPDALVEIHAAVDMHERTVRVTVADNGEGMTPETLARIFNLFESTKGSRGTGLGLTVSRKILREHDGDIRAESRPGVGSTFTIEFPLRLEPPPDADDDPPDDESGRTLAPGMPGPRWP